MLVLQLLPMSTLFHSEITAVMLVLASLVKTRLKKTLCHQGDNASVGRTTDLRMQITMKTNNNNFNKSQAYVAKNYWGGAVNQIILKQNK